MTAFLYKSHADFSNDCHSTVSVSYPNLAIKLALMINEIFALLFVYFNLNQRWLNQDYDDFNPVVLEQTHQHQTGN